MATESQIAIDSISAFRAGERVGPSKVYKCCACGFRSFDGNKFGELYDGSDICVDDAMCEKRQQFNHDYDPETYGSDRDCDGVLFR
jgi:hypothetical protein